jgi:signal transduction histidine kinase/CheY-like chemotaxis protein
MENKFKNLKNKTLAITILLISFIVTLFFYISITEKRDTLNKELIYKKQHVELVYMKYAEQLKLKYSNKLRKLLNSEEVMKAFAQRDREKLNNLVQPYFDQLKKDEPNFEIICFGLPNMTAFLRAHRPDLYGDDLRKVQGVKIVTDERREVGGFMITKLGLYYRINTPVYYENKYIGLVSFGISIGAVNDYISRNFNSDVAILIETEKFKNSDWYNQLEEGTIGKYTIVTSTNDLIAENAEKISMSGPSKIQINDKIYFTHQDNSIYDLDNHEIAKILLLQNITSEENSLQEHILWFSILGLSLFFIIIFILIKTFNKMVYELYILNKSLEYKVKERTLELEKQTQISQEATKARGSFLANMSHEIRTPLNAIVGFINLLQERVCDKTDLEYLNIVDKASQSLLGVINDILDFSKIENGKIELESIDFDANDEFQTLLKLFEAQAKEKKINLVVQMSELPDSLNSDILRIKQVVANLLSNAIKFTSENKQVKLTISYKNNILYIGVQDQGIGISKENTNKVFEAFSQAENSTTRKFGGTGLGLSISHELVKLLGGELKVESELGKGSNFYFSIPVQIGDTIKKEKMKNIQLKGHILLVEDNKANQIFMKVVLKNMGLTFDVANDGVEAIEYFKKNRYDCILMDENMPNMNGIEATKNIVVYEKELHLQHTPIIALTANAIKGDRERFLESGMDDYLTKPLDKNKLISIFSGLLRK